MPEASGCTLIGGCMTMFVLMSGVGSEAAAEIGWPEAVGRLAGEKTKAVACASAFVTYAPKKQISTRTAAYKREGGL
jgi:hypothetical protein